MHGDLNSRSASGRYYIGLMSGTSTDGVDGVLADFQDPAHPTIVASASLAMPSHLQSEFLALNQPGANELERMAIAGNKLAELYAETVRQLLTIGRLSAQHIQAIGAHGQTVRHHPEAGYTIQINAPAYLAELTHIPVIADFRSRDIAAGGQGAPLVPAFHQAIFTSPQARRAILNLGGIANVTLIDDRGNTRGFDTGPANVLLDTWIRIKQGKDYDHNGRWAATGRVNPGLLQYLLDSEPWLDLAPPKSTGRHLFNEAWLNDRLTEYARSAEARIPTDADVQATLQAFTAHTVGDAIKRHAPDTDEVIVCGGGALNTGLMEALKEILPCRVGTTDQYGIPVQLMEALAFAWLARAWDEHIPAGLPSVTGAKAPRILGCRYPA